MVSAWIATLNIRYALRTDLRWRRSGPDTALSLISTRWKRIDRDLPETARGYWITAMPSPRTKLDAGLRHAFILVLGHATIALSFLIQNVERDTSQIKSSDNDFHVNSGGGDSPDTCSGTVFVTV